MVNPSCKVLSVPTGEGQSLQPRPSVSPMYWTMHRLAMGQYALSQSSVSLGDMQQAEQQHKLYMAARWLSASQEAVPLMPTTRAFAPGT
jgi:hypothetical protein